MSRIESHNSSSPLFLYVAYQAPHFPIMKPPAAYLKMYSGPQHASMRRRGALNRPATISALDAGVGEIVASLKRSGLWENSVLLFSTDNGGPVPASSNLPLRGTKESLYEGGVRGVALLAGGALALSARQPLPRQYNQYVASSLEPRVLLMLILQVDLHH